MARLCKCNYCRYRRLLKQAHKEGNFITRVRRKEGGFDFYIHPQSEDPIKVVSKFAGRYWSMYLLQFQTKCFNKGKSNG